MQTIAPAGARNPNGHTEAEILSALRAPVRRFTFRYELYDKFRNLKLPHLDGVESCTIDQNWLARIKRTARFRIRDLGQIDYLSDFIKPYVRLHLPPFGPDDYVAYPQGLFLLSSPKRSIDRDGVVTRDVSAYDRLQALEDDKPNLRVKLSTTTEVIDAVYTQLGYLTTSGFRPPGGPIYRTTVREWEPGTPRLTIVNDLLDMINYNSLSYDEDGRDVIRPYTLPSERAEEFVYGVGSDGLIVPELDQEVDLFSVPNQWTRTVSEPDRPVLTSTYTNSNPASLTSTVRRGRTISDVQPETDAATQAILNAKVARLAFEGSQVYESIDFQTAMMPFHSGNDVYRITYPALGINAKYVEQSWTLELRAGATMKHRARRVITV